MPIKKLEDNLDNKCDKILITGNMGYIGSVLVNHLRNTCPQAYLIGYDLGYFANQLTNVNLLPEVVLNTQYFGDVRKFPPKLLEGVSAIIYLSAISNDPMGNKYEQGTFDINHKACISLAQRAKNMGVKSFIFASSCSIYGSASDSPRTENSPLDPITAYARSKAFSERDLKELASDDFAVTCLRFSTACGMSPRLRLDLVLNDFVASAVAQKKITILSDGKPWRPLIHVKDMSRAIEWAIKRISLQGDEFLAINVGSNDWNYQVRDLAEAVAVEIPGTKISINKDAAPDKRSYRVNFELFKTLAPDFIPRITLSEAIRELKYALEESSFCDENFRDSRSFIRLKTLDFLRSKKLLTDSLEWSY